MCLAMTAALPFADLPSLIQEALLRKPRRAGVKLCVPSGEKTTHNNYRAVEPSNWGRNRKGAGAPRGNRNAGLGGLTRAEARLQRRLTEQRARIAVLTDLIEQLETTASLPRESEGI